MSTRIPDYALENLGVKRSTWDKITATAQGRENFRRSLVTIEDMYPDRSLGVHEAFRYLEILDRAEAAR